MRGVGDELALALDSRLGLVAGGVELAQHLVQGPRQLGDLVLVLGLGDPQGRVAGTGDLRAVPVRLAIGRIVRWRRPCRRSRRAGCRRGHRSRGRARAGRSSCRARRVPRVLDVERAVRARLRSGAWASATVEVADAAQPPVLAGGPSGISLLASRALPSTLTTRITASLAARARPGRDDRESPPCRRRRY